MDGVLLHEIVRSCARSVHDFPVPGKSNPQLHCLATADCSRAYFRWDDTSVVPMLPNSPVVRSTMKHPEAVLPQVSFRR